MLYRYALCVFGSGLYLESAKESGSKFRDMEKRSRLFVGKRLPSTSTEDADDYIVVSSLDGGSPFVGEEFKRNHLFVGKRGTPRFVGKRSVVGLLTRAKRFAENEDAKDAAAVAERGGEDDDAWKKAWMEGGDEEGEDDDKKRARMFVGKRRGGGADRESELNAKRSRLFVGRRSGLLPWREADGFSVEGGGDEEKRSRLFVGKRPSYDDHRGQKNAAGGGEGSKAAAEKGESVDGGVQSPDAPSQVAELDKRPRLFPGKRPAPGFVGKRPAPGFVGKRDA